MTRWIAALVVVLAATSACATTSHAQAGGAYPTRAIKLVAPFPAGGTTDLVARVLAHRMTQLLGQPAIVENKAGASGSIGVQTVVLAPPDGYTALIAPSTAVVINPHVTRVPYDVERDLRPVGLIMKAETLIVAHPSKNLGSLADVIGYAKSNPGKLTFGSFGIGSSAHLVMAHLQAVAGIEMLHVPYKGAAPAELALMAGEIDILVVNSITAFPNIEAGRMIPIALLSSAQSTLLPKLARASDQLPDFVFDTWVALYAPAKTSNEIVGRLSGAMVEALNDPALIADFRAKGIEPAPGSPEELVAYQQNESRRWARATASAKAKDRLD